MSWPDVDQIVLSLLRPAVPDALVAPELPPLERRTFPMVVAFNPSSPGPLDPRFTTSATYDVQCWSRDRSEAWQLGGAVHLALVAAWRSQSTTDHGHISTLDVISSPSRLRTRDQDPGLHRTQATYQIGVRLSGA